jgi:hypothetical protein
MLGRGSYGPGGKWVYERAKHLRDKNPDMEESTSFAIATQQAHKLGRSSKSHRTVEGVRVAREKYSRPMKEYQKTAMLHGFFDELEKIANPLGVKPLGANALGLGSPQTASSLGISPGLGASDLGIGKGPSGAAAAPPPPPPTSTPPTSTGPQSGSLIGSGRIMGTGSMGK